LTPDKKTIWSLLSAITDPEIPVLSITDLGIVRDVQIDGGDVEVIITPTYSGCPAMDVIASGIRLELEGRGYGKIAVTQVLSPAWTTDWMTETGKEKLKAYGIAPPQPQRHTCTPGLFATADAVPCPQCGSWHTKLLSEFGSTACKALYQCQDCKEPFDYFKCH
jgi:ring-1,2-phenylacetyl-CoA epoxidase subunit PaaD